MTGVIDYGPFFWTTSSLFKRHYVTERDESAFLVFPLLLFWGAPRCCWCFYCSKEKERHKYSNLINTSTAIASGMEYPSYSELLWELFPERLERGWPLLTVETEMHGDSKRTNERGLSWLVCWACPAVCRYKRFLFCLGFSSQPSTKDFFPHRTLFQFLSHHRPASWAGSRAGSPVS